MESWYFTLQILKTLFCLAIVIMSFCSQLLLQRKLQIPALFLFNVRLSCGDAESELCL